MKKERILNALGGADDKYVEEAMPTAALSKELRGAGIEGEGVQAEPVTVNAPKRKIYAGSIAAAACACVAAGGLIFWSAVGDFGGLSEEPYTGSSDEFAQTMSPEENGYHNFTLTLEQLYGCAWSCFIPEYFPEGYHFNGEARCTQANGVVDTPTDMDISFWLSNGIDDPDAKGYNPVYFSVTVGDNSIVEGEHIYELETLTVNDITEMGKGGLISCGHNVRLQIGCPYPELVPAEEIHSMIMSMPYAKQWIVYDSGYHIEYLTGDEVYSTPFADCLPTALPAGYGITGLSPYTYTKYNSISLYISNGVEDPELSNYCPIRYAVQYYSNGIDSFSSDKPVYQNIWELTLQDVEAAMESGGFFTVYNDTALIEVSFPRADRISAEEIYSMVLSAPCAVNPNGNKEYAVVYLSQEELYNCQWHMFLPRYVPDGYAFAGKASYVPTEFMDDGVMTYRFREQESGNTIEFVFTTDFFGGSYENAELNLSELTASDMAKVKSGGLIYCENGGSTLRVNIDKPELVSDGELYKTLMSVPVHDVFQNSGIATVDLSEYIGADVPTVAFEQFYNIQKVKIRTKFNERDSFLPFFDQETYNGGGLEGELGTIVGFDGKNVYFVSTGTVDSMDENGKFTTLSVSSIGMYDIPNDSYKQLVRYYERDVEFICADGEFIYYTVSDHGLQSDFCRRNINDPIYGTVDNSPLLSVDGKITDTAVNGSFIYLSLISNGQYTLVSFDMNEDVEADIAANKLYISMIEIPDTIERIMPYKDGAAYNLKNDTRSFYYWNGGQDGEAALLFRAEVDTEIYSDGEIFYTLTDGKLFTGTDYYNQTYEDKQCFDVLDIMNLSVSDRVYLAHNNGVDSSPLYAFAEAPDMASADSMIVPSPHMGIIYDAKRGWFTHVDPSKEYQSRSSFGSSLLMLEGEAQNDYFTLCIITRK